MKYLKKFENIGTMTSSDKAHMDSLPRIDKNSELEELITKVEQFNTSASEPESIQNEVILCLLNYVANRNMDKDHLNNAIDSLNKYLSKKSYGQNQRTFRIPHQPPIAA